MFFGAHCVLNLFSLHLHSVPPDTTEEPVVILPTNAPYEVKFSKTTTYHWPNFDLNVTENEDKGFDATQQGPFGFGNAVDIDASKQQVKFFVSTSSTLLLINFSSVSLTRISLLMETIASKILSTASMEQRFHSFSRLSTT